MSRTDAGTTEQKLRYLKGKGVSDPNLDMFVAIFDNDAPALKSALDAGADVSVTDLQVLAAHQTELAEFEADHEIGPG